MAKKKFHRARSMTIPIAPIIGIASMPHLREAVKAGMAGNWDAALANLGGIVGISSSAGSFYGINLGYLIENMVPLTVGILIHKYIGGKLGVNRILAQAGVPLIRI